MQRDYQGCTTPDSSVDAVLPGQALGKSTPSFSAASIVMMAKLKINKRLHLKERKLPNKQTQLASRSDKTEQGHRQVQVPRTHVTFSYNARAAAPSRGSPFHRTSALLPSQFCSSKVSVVTALFKKRAQLL